MIEQIPPELFSWEVGGIGGLIGGAIVYLARKVGELAKRADRFMDHMEHEADDQNRHRTLEIAHWLEVERSLREVASGSITRGVSGTPPNNRHATHAGP